MIIFDFDGVLLNSFDTLYKINKKSASGVGITLSKKDYKNFFKGNIHKTRSRIFKGDLEKSRKFGEARENLYNRYYNSENVKLFEFAPFLIKRLSKKTKVYIVSSSPKEFIEDILEKNGLKSYFNGITGTNIEGKRKTIQNYLEQAEDSGDSYFITDTVGDIKEVKGLDIKVVAVGWGFHSLKTLLKPGPDYAAYNYDDLEKILV